MHSCWRCILCQSNLFWVEQKRRNRRRGFSMTKALSRYLRSTVGFKNLVRSACYYAPKTFFPINYTGHNFAFFVADYFYDHLAQVKKIMNRYLPVGVGSREMNWVPDYLPIGSKNSSFLKTFASTNSSPWTPLNLGRIRRNVLQSLRGWRRLIHSPSLLFFSIRFTEEEVEEMFNNAPMDRQGNLLYPDFCKTIKGSSKEED